MSEEHLQRVRDALQRFWTGGPGPQPIPPDPEAGYLWFAFPFASPSQNVWERRKPWVKAKWIQRYRWIIRQQVGAQRAVRLGGRVRCVLFKRFSSGRLDYGNLVGGCKGILDALVREGVLLDDTPKILRDTYEQHDAPRREGRTEVEVRSLARTEDGRT